MVEVQEHHAEFQRRGVRVAAVGQATGDEAARYARAAGAGFPCLGDPGRKAYRGFGLGRSDWWSMLAKPFLEDPALAWHRIRNANLEGARLEHSDVKQLGGVAILDRRGVIRYLHRSRRTEDYPPTSEVLAELDRLTL
ncbi:MAG: AhpC/TSA family protein [Myxococcota bacterium]|nr:AhpC/TSA family protein [Myxococcota bacterium]MDP6243125.1 AhpC/TSA family protein [Myxococcota bacterium]MDP7074077.1 AhpC/TSA family protein [Myxococcota bacterium]MDP7299242.1 AhpC/TSA family protein [Myxococcota bacterium]MDP7431944.1 AhpC/TSA family protein [Myxococcota bacterium]